MSQDAVASRTKQELFARPAILDSQQLDHQNRDLCLYPTCIRRPRYGCSRRNIAIPFGVEWLTAWLPGGEKISKISLFVLTQLTDVTDTQTHRHTDTA